MAASPDGFQSWVFWASCLQAGALKFGALDVGSQPFTPQVEAESWDFPHLTPQMYSTMLLVEVMVRMFLSLSCLL